jgi:hypothetical protein
MSVVVMGKTVMLNTIVRMLVAVMILRTALDSSKYNDTPLVVYINLSSPSSLPHYTCSPKRIKTAKTQDNEWCGLKEPTPVGNVAVLPSLLGV